MKLIDEWRMVVWRSATTWTAAALGGLLGALAAHWGVLFAIVPFLPILWQLPVAIALGVLFIAGPIVLARVADQPKLQAKIEEKRSGQ